MRNLRLLLALLILPLAGFAQNNPNYGPSSGSGGGSGSGTVSSGTAGQVAFYIGTTQVKGDSGFIYNSATATVTISGSLIATASATGTVSATRLYSGLASVTTVAATQVSSTNISATNISFTGTGSRGVYVASGGLLAISSDYQFAAGSSRRSTFGLNVATISTGVNMDISGSVSMTTLQLATGISGTLDMGEVSATTSTSYTLNTTLYNAANLTLTASPTFALSGTPSASSNRNVTVRFIQGGTGTNIISWTTVPAIIWTGGVTPTLSVSVSTVDIINFYYGGGKWHGFYSGADMR